MTFDLAKNKIAIYAHRRIKQNWLHFSTPEHLERLHTHEIKVNIKSHTIGH